MAIGVQADRSTQPREDFAADGSGAVRAIGRSIMKQVSMAIVAATLAITVASCAGAKRPSLQPSALPPGATLWEQPVDVAAQDLFYGPWGRELAPDPRDTYTFV